MTKNANARNLFVYSVLENCISATPFAKNLGNESQILIFFENCSAAVEESSWRHAKSHLFPINMAISFMMICGRFVSSPQELSRLSKAESRAFDVSGTGGYSAGKELHC